MGQYHLTVNLDKKEFLNPHKLGCGLKLWEQLASPGNTGDALLLLLSCSNGRGGGDIHVDEYRFEEGEVIYFIPEGKEDLAAAIEAYVGRWAGDRIAVVGDYTKDDDLSPSDEASSIYGKCRDGVFRDITDDLLPVIEYACGVKITGEGWRDKVSAS